MKTLKDIQFRLSPLYEHTWHHLENDKWALSSGQLTFTESSVEGKANVWITCKGVEFRYGKVSPEEALTMRSINEK